MFSAPRLWPEQVRLQELRLLLGRVELPAVRIPAGRLLVLPAAGPGRGLPDGHGGWLGDPAAGRHTLHAAACSPCGWAMLKSYMDSAGSLKPGFRVRGNGQKWTCASNKEWPL